jgi:acetyl esterase/lipase
MSAINKRGQLEGARFASGIRFLARLGAVICAACMAASGEAGEPDKSAVTHPYPLGDRGDLWLMAGRSNMGGYALMKQKTEPDPRILFFASGKDQWVVAKDPVHNLFFRGAAFIPKGSEGAEAADRADVTAEPVLGTGPCLFFGKHLIRSTNRPIGLIGVSSGGWMAQVWDPRRMVEGKMPPRPYLYGPMIQRVIRAGGYGKLKGMVWDQGGSDAIQKPSVAKDYERNLTAFINGVRRDAGHPRLPVIVVQLGRYVSSALPGTSGKSGAGEEYDDLHAAYTSGCERVREAQRRVAEKLENVYLVPSADLYPMEDPAHWGFEAYQRLGPRVAEVALSQVYKLPGHGTPIKLQSIESGERRDPRTGGDIPGHHQTTIRLRFNGVSGRLHAAGRPLGFSLRFPGITPEAARQGVPVIFTVEFDPKDPAAVLLHVTGRPDNLLKRAAVLCYGAGVDPLMNITDDKDMAIPAFGPVEIPAPRKRIGTPAPEERTNGTSQKGRAGSEALKVPAGIVHRRDVEYRPGGTGSEWRLDYAKPARPAGLLPAIVMVHGGGWKGSNGKANYGPICIDWARRGYFVMAINYRISSSSVHTFPAAIEDCKCAVRWLRAHARTLGVDANRIGVYGSSAGGHLALMLGILSKQKFSDHYEGDGPWQDQSSEVCAVVSDAGVINLDQTLPGNSVLKRAFNDFLGGTPPDKAKVHDASPASYASRASRFPPFLMLYGTADRQVPIGLTDSFVNALRANKHPDLTYLRYAGVDHSPWWLQWEKNRVPAVKGSRGQIEGFFDRTLANVKTPARSCRR